MKPPPVDEKKDKDKKEKVKVAKRIAKVCDHVDSPEYWQIIVKTSVW